MKPAFWIPEVLQTSLMDCGPAALKAVLQGFGIDVHYEWLRDRCQTDVDGTSIDALARLGEELGLHTAEMAVPHDSFLLPEAKCLPAIVVKRGASGALHFIVVWRMLGNFVQILDPGSGRRWVSKRGFLEDMPFFPIPISIERWQRWARSEDSLAPLLAKLRALGIPGKVVDRAVAAQGWRPLATLDAAARMTARLVRAGAVRKGRQAERMLEAVLERAQSGDAAAIPRGFWWATTGKQEGKLLVHGAVIVHFARRRSLLPCEPVPVLPRGVAHGALQPRLHDAANAPCLDVALPAAARRELGAASPSPLALLWHLLSVDAGRAWALLAVAFVALAALAVVDVVVLRGLFDAVRYVTLDYQRALGIGALVGFALASLLLEVFAVRAVSWLGRGLEVRLRRALLEKLPRLEDRYLRSRPSSDMTARAHALHLMREAPVLLARIARSGLSFLATLAAILWLYPRGAVVAAAAAVAAVAAPYLARRPLVESLMRVRTHAASLERFYLDALLGVVPIRVHGAARAVRREHEALLVEWSASARSVHAQTTVLQLVQGFASTAVAVVLVVGYLASGGALSALLGLVFWALRLPVLAQDIVAALVGWRNVRNVALRLFAPLAAPQLKLPSGASDSAEVGQRGAGLALHGVSVEVNGHLLLADLTLEVAGGSHVAIVGASGAGKSSLLSLLLGWLRPSRGQIVVDDRVLDDEGLVRLREATAWVDPTVHLWNGTLLQNMLFGHPEAALGQLSRGLRDAELLDVLENLPQGLNQELGEGGARLSGGEGQRIRLARALLRNRAQLVLLDEPFRGLERDRRRALLGRARELWRQSTLLCVSHDVGDTLEFDRVLVIDAGRVVEDGCPRALLADERSRYHGLWDADRRARAEVWCREHFRPAAIQLGRWVEAAR